MAYKALCHLGLAQLLTPLQTSPPFSFITQPLCPSLCSWNKSSLSPAFALVDPPGKMVSSRSLHGWWAPSCRAQLKCHLWVVLPVILCKVASPPTPVPPRHSTYHQLKLFIDLLTCYCWSHPTIKLHTSRNLPPSLVHDQPLGTWHIQDIQKVRIK